MTDASHWTLPQFMEFVSEQFESLRRELGLKDEALRLQAAEYQRRLDALNHAHEKAIEVQHTYVTREKYDQQVAALETARKLEAERTTEKFEEHVKRYELRQREVDNALAASDAAAKTSKEASANAAQLAKTAAEEQGRKNNRNIGVVGVLLSILIAASNYLGAQG